MLSIIIAADKENREEEPIRMAEAVPAHSDPFRAASLIRIVEGRGESGRRTGGSRTKEGRGYAGSDPGVECADMLAPSLGALPLDFSRIETGRATASISACLAFQRQGHRHHRSTESRWNHQRQLYGWMIGKQGKTLEAKKHQSHDAFC